MTGRSPGRSPAPKSAPGWTLTPEQVKYVQAKYKLTKADYEQLVNRSGNTCWICRRPPKKKRLNIDHCHRTGKVRGLLCYMCNRKIVGAIDRRKVDPQRIADYLKGEISFD
jgi:hypothetical protein